MDSTTVYLDPFGNIQIHVARKYFDPMKPVTKQIIHDSTYALRIAAETVAANDRTDARVAGNGFMRIDGCGDYMLSIQIESVKGKSKSPERQRAWTIGINPVNADMGNGNSEQILSANTVKVREQLVELVVRRGLDEKLFKTEPSGKVDAKQGWVQISQF